MQSACGARLLPLEFTWPLSRITFYEPDGRWPLRNAYAPAPALKAELARLAAVVQVTEFKKLVGNTDHYPEHVRAYDEFFSLDRSYASLVALRQPAPVAADVLPTSYSNLSMLAWYCDAAIEHDLIVAMGI